MRLGGGEGNLHTERKRRALEKPRQLGPEDNTEVESLSGIAAGYTAPLELSRQETFKICLVVAAKDCCSAELFSPGQAAANFSLNSIQRSL